MKAWGTLQRSTKEDWIEWMRGLMLEVLKESPSSALRACSELAAKYPPLAHELFNKAFLSCWTELHEQYQVGSICLKATHFLYLLFCLDCATKLSLVIIFSFSTNRTT
jgi:phosphatidylinositol kinase/protein kinase (PI-3  family)